MPDEPGAAGAIEETVDRPVTLTVAAARYLLTRYYRPFLLSGNCIQSEYDLAVFGALTCYIEMHTSRARFEAEDERVSTPNLAGEHPMTVLNTGWRALNETFSEAERGFYTHKASFDKFMRECGDGWLQEAATAGVHLS